MFPFEIPKVDRIHEPRVLCEGRVAAAAANLNSPRRANSPCLWDSVFDADTDSRQRLDHLLHRRLVRKDEEDRGWKKNRRC